MHFVMYKLCCNDTIGWHEFKDECLFRIVCEIHMQEVNKVVKYESSNTFEIVASGVGS